MLTEIHENVRVGDWRSDTERRFLQAKIFHHMVRLAPQAMDDYYGDLFHDARYLAATLISPQSVIYWGYGIDGTSIGTEAAPVSQNQTHVYEIRIHTDGPREGFIMTPLACPTERGVEVYVEPCADEDLVKARDLRHGDVMIECPGRCEFPKGGATAHNPQLSEPRQVVAVRFEAADGAAGGLVQLPAVRGLVQLPADAQVIIRPRG